jgi:hypothetical protein
MINEVWKSVPGYETLYVVSSLGRVKSLSKKGAYRELVMRPKLEGGYFRLMLCKQSKRRSFRIHRLVAMAFLPNPGNLPQVNHIDGVKTNNNVNNLEWCTASYNISHAFRTGLNQISETQKRLIGINTSKRQKKRIVVIDIIEHKSTLYSSVNEAGFALSCVPSAISTCLKRNSLLRKRYKPIIVSASKFKEELNETE